MMDGAERPVGDPASILIVEDHVVLSQGMALVLRQEGYEVTNLDVAGLAPSALLGTVTARVFDVVLLDLDLGPAGHSNELIAPLSAAGSRVIILTGEEDPAELGQCLRAGAVAVLSKTAPLDEVLALVERAVAGESVMSVARREKLLEGLRLHQAGEKERLGRFSSLTPREEEVLTALIEGRTAAQVAASGFVSLATVRSQIRSVFQKLGVNSQLQAVVVAREAGWRPKARP
jgi:DNA-binding NarL/FixJ family response regulator